MVTHPLLGHVHQRQVLRPVLFPRAPGLVEQPPRRVVGPDAGPAEAGERRCRQIEGVQGRQTGQELVGEWLAGTRTEVRAQTADLSGGGRRRFGDPRDIGVDQGGFRKELSLDIDEVRTGAGTVPCTAPTSSNSRSRLVAFDPSAGSIRTTIRSLAQDPESSRCRVNPIWTLDTPPVNHRASDTRK